MFTDFQYYVVRQFKKSDNGLVQLMLFNGLIFIGLLCLKTVFILIEYEQAYYNYWNYVTLPAVWDSFLQQPWSLLTYFWLHDGFFQILWHLLFLNSFGQLVLYKLRSRNLIALYMLGGIGGGLCFLLLYNLAPGLHSMPIRLIGAPASLYAVMTGAAFLLPDFYFSLFLIGRVKVKYIAACLLLLSFVELSQRQASGIANLSGALIGYLYVRYGILPNWKKIFPQFFMRVLKKNALKVSYNKEKKESGNLSSQLKNNITVDRILDKVAESGYTSLTKEEKKQLFDGGQ